MKYLILTVAMFLLSACVFSSVNGTRVDDISVNSYFTVDGMTCINIKVEKAYSYNNIVCNWDEWNGTKEGKVTK